MRGKTAVAIFHGKQYAEKVQLFQYDYGQILKMPDINLPATYEVHFGNSVNGTAVPQIGNENGVRIPDEIIESAGDKFAWVFLHEGPDDGETEYVVPLHIKARAKNTGAEPTPVQQDVITTAIAALNSGVDTVAGIAEAIPQTINDALAEAKASGEFDGPPGPKGDTGITGDPGPRGLPGVDGKDGTDGISPSVLVSDITGGHRVFITDKDGTESFDVMDGVNGSDGRDGSDGVSPVVAVMPITGGHRVTISDKSGTETFDVVDGINGEDGSNGQNGSDGFSPIVSVTDITGGHQVAITDAGGTQVFSVLDGQRGPQGETGSAGSPGAAGKDGKDGADGSPGAAGADGADGVTYTPSVSAEGVISWTNDGGRTNPESVSIKGPQGDPGLSAPLVVNSASGPIASFTDGSNGWPIKSLVVGIEPVQSGSGDPSPDNVRPITGWTGAKVTRTGKNLLNPTMYLWQTKTQNGISYDVQNDGTIHAYGTATATGGPNLCNYFELPNGTYSTINESVNHIHCAYRKRNKSNGSTSALSNPFTVDGSFEIYVNLYCDASSGTYDYYIHPQIELGSTATTYEPYSGTTLDITFPSEAGTVYGGTLDVTNGTLMVTWACVDLSRLEWTTRTTGENKKSIYSVLPYNYTGYPATVFPAIAEQYTQSGVTGYYSGSNDQKIVNPDAQEIGWLFYRNSGNVTPTVFFMIVGKNDTPTGKLAYRVATPIVYTLTPVEVTTLLATNNIWADTGDVSVDYCADTKTYVDESIADSGYYTKPSTGIPASDLASGVIPTVHNVPAGGTTGQVLAKSSNSDYAMSWVTPNPVQSVSGTTPSITAQAGYRYECGEVATLSFTPCQSGCCDVVFSSGSTPTVLTVPNTVKWPDWFDPDNLEANAVYEINIINGTLGAVGVWT